MYWLGCLHSCGWDFFVLVLGIFDISQCRNVFISQQKVLFVDCWHYFLRQCSSEHGNERNNATQNLVTLCGADSQNNKEEGGQANMVSPSSGGFCVVSLADLPLMFFRYSSVVWEDSRQSSFPRDWPVFSSWPTAPMEQLGREHLCLLCPASNPVKFWETDWRDGIGVRTQAVSRDQE